MKKLLSWVSVLGFSMVHVVTACGDAGHKRRGGGADEDGGAGDGGIVGTAGTLHASGSHAGGTDGGTPAVAAGTGNDGGTGVGEGGSFASGGTSAPGTAGTEPVPEGGMPSSAGSGPTNPGTGGTDTESGGTGSGATGGEEPMAGTGTVGSGGDGAGASGGAGASVGIGGGGASAEGGAGAGGTSSEPPPVCGDGVFSPEQSCCTPQWVDANISLVSAVVGGALVGTTSCIGREQRSLFAICDSATCAAGATGCRTEITAATLEYSPDTQEISGSASVVIDGHASVGQLGCDFRATIDDLRYRAHVIRRVTPAAVHFEIGEPDIEDYTVRVSGCFGVGGIAAFLLNNPLAREAVEAPIRDLLLDRVELDQPCPY